MTEDVKRFLGSEAVRDRHDDEASDDALYTNMSSKVHLEEFGRCCSGPGWVTFLTLLVESRTLHDTKNRISSLLVLV